MENININKFDSYTLSRWLALHLAVEKIFDTCITLNKNFEHLEISPIPIKKYINVVSQQIENDLKTSKTYCNII